VLLKAVDRTGRLLPATFLLVHLRFSFLKLPANRHFSHFGKRHLCHFFHKRHRPQVTVAVPTNGDSYARRHEAKRPSGLEASTAARPSR
jgi:hypothetical protein